MICLICHDTVLRSASIWSCSKCFTIFHMSCILKWVRSSASAAHASWRCPVCQFVYVTPACDLAYTCFCGRRRDPPDDHSLTPHSCGETCSKPLDRAEPPDAMGEYAATTRCPHVCLLQCHPGPCPPCIALIPDRRCRCEKHIIMRRCGDQIAPDTCGHPCEQMLSCGRHCCEVCHTGSCKECPRIISVTCFCGKKNEKWPCRFVMPNWELSENEKVFSCNQVCGRTLDCGNHTCKNLCHSGSCGSCEAMPGKVTTCHCGRTVSQEIRSCLEPVRNCNEICGKKLLCEVHRCKVKCHGGDCPPCSVSVEKSCMCGLSSQMFRCCYIPSMEVYRCSKHCGQPSGFGDATSSSGGGQVCGIARRDCKHTCTAPCHPLSQCPDLVCLFPVTITCSCGRVTASVPCGSGGGASEGKIVFEMSVIEKLPMPLQPVESNGRRVPLGKMKLSCDEECAKMEKKRVLAEAFGITPFNLDAFPFDENSSSLDLVADLFGREPKWVLAVEDRCKFLVLGKLRGSSSFHLKLHVFCHMSKDKRDVICIIARWWNLSVLVADCSKHFVIIHATPESKPPARILGSKAGAPITAACPYFDPLIDMDPRVVVMLDLLWDPEVNAQFLRSCEGCDCVWLNDKNAIAVFDDPARAEKLLSQVEFGTNYQGAALFMPSSAQASSGSYKDGPGDVDDREEAFE